MNKFQSIKNWLNEWYHELNLIDSIGEELETLIGRMDPYENKIISDAWFREMERDDVCNPMVFEYEDDTEHDYYGYDVISLLKKFNLM